MRDNAHVEADDLRKRIEEQEELLEQAEKRQEDVEEQIDEAHEHAPDEDA